MRLRLLLFVCVLFQSEAFADSVSNEMATNVMPSPTQATSALSVEHWLWQKIPLSLPLTVGQERVIFFPGTQMAFDPGVRSAMQLRVQSAGGVIYLKPQVPFPTTRMMAQDLTSGAVYFFDVSASSTPSDNTPVQIIDAAGSPSSTPAVMNDTANNTLLAPTVSNAVSSPVSDYPSLVRYAVQELYAPLRLVIPRSDVRRTPMNTPMHVNLFVGKNGGGALSAQPLATWTDGTFFVTAVLIKNLTHQPRLLDPRTLLGMWVAVAFFPRSTVQAAGNHADHTTVFLVSAQPFTQALGAPNDHLE